MTETEEKLGRVQRAAVIHEREQLETDGQHDQHKQARVSSAMRSRVNNNSAPSVSSRTASAYGWVGSQSMRLVLEIPGGVAVHNKRIDGAAVPAIPRSGSQRAASGKHAPQRDESTRTPLAPASRSTAVIAASSRQPSND